MALNDALLMSWCAMDGWETHLEQHGAMAQGVSTEQFKAVEAVYFAVVKRRIASCEEWLKSSRSPLLYYTLAELHNRSDVEESPASFYKRPVRRYALKALRLNPRYAAAWALLATAYDWIAFVGGETPHVPTITLDPGYGPREIDVAVLKQKSYVAEPYTLDAQQQRQIRAYDRAIRCMTKAMQLDPDNQDYPKALRNYGHDRNEAYKPGHVVRIIGPYRSPCA